MGDPRIEPTENELVAALNTMMDRYEAVVAKNKALQARLDALMTAFDENGTLGVLQTIAHDASLDPALRVRAAGLAVPFERPKLSVTATTSVPLFDLLEARRRKGKVIEHAPDPGPPTAA